ncbi:MAG: hypothetical protein RLZZ505_1782 [Verrucomicrobiota bacterium]|jgi:UPF0271 protein
MQTIDLNVDLGEGGEHDAAQMALASSVNIACGGHAGDDETIRRAVEMAIHAKSAIGAHPGYEDRANFGRKPLFLTNEAIRSLILRQLERILSFHPQLHHIKPHGALYNQSNQNEAMAEALVGAVAEVQPQSILYCPPHGALARAAALHKLSTCAEGFIDRRYQHDGSLCTRSEERALIENMDEAVSQALSIAIRHSVVAVNGAVVPLKVRTLCVHGDSRGSVPLLKLTRSSLERADIRIMAP